MHVSLTDLVTCPRCGPTYGLVLMPEEVRDRRVVAGVMGCANCRERYRVEGGVADLRGPGASEPVAGGAEPGAEAGAGEAVRLAALMGLADAGGTVLLLGPAAARGGEIAALVERVEVVVAGSESGSESESASASKVEGGGVGVDASVSRLWVSDPIPLRSGSMRGVVLSGREAWRLEEGARVVAPGGRLVVEPAPLDARERLEAAGLRVLAAEGGTVVAGR